MHHLACAGCSTLQEELPSRLRRTPVSRSVFVAAMLIGMQPGTDTAHFACNHHLPDASATCETLRASSFRCVCTWTNCVPCPCVKLHFQTITQIHGRLLMRLIMFFSRVFVAARCRKAHPQGDFTRYSSSIAMNIHGLKNAHRMFSAKDHVMCFDVYVVCLNGWFDFAWV